MIPEQIDVEKIGINEVYYFAIEQRCFTEQHAVEDSINQIPDSTSQDHRQRNPKGKVLTAGFIQVKKNTYAGDDRKNRKEEFATKIDTECHARVFDIGESKEITYNWLARSKLESWIRNTKRRNTKSFDNELRYLVTKDNKEA